MFWKSWKKKTTPKTDTSPATRCVDCIGYNEGDIELAESASVTGFCKYKCWCNSIQGTQGLDKKAAETIYWHCKNFKRR